MKFKSIITALIIFICSSAIFAQPSDGGTLNSSVDSVCSGVNSEVLSLTGHIGTVQYWEMSYSLGGPWFTINNPNSSISITNLTQTSYFRAIVKNGINPSDTSSIKEIIVCPVSIGGVISGDSGVCALSNTGELNLTAHIGSVQLWQSSNNGGLTWNNISNTSNSLNYNNLSQTLLYRAEVKSGVRPSAFSEHFEVLVSPADRK
ncbi:MAG: hypothetical protein PHE56_14655, partial [Bacteroidales bacterium]|nr:hypothetical protein [Bacteroidales bacterium]